MSSESTGKIKEKQNKSYRRKQFEQDLEEQLRYMANGNKSLCKVCTQTYTHTHPFNKHSMMLIPRPELHSSPLN